MEIQATTVEQLAKLARLHFTADEKATLAKDLAKITDFFAQISTVDTENVAPLTHLNDINNVLRNDEVIHLSNTPQADALKNAPKTDGTYFIVPQVVDKTKA